MRTHLEDANLVDAKLRKANLDSADLVGAELTQAKLEKAFWAISDYGSSAPRVILTFSTLAAAFALLYLIPGQVDGL